MQFDLFTFLCLPVQLPRPARSAARLSLQAGDAGDGRARRANREQLGRGGSEKQEAEQLRAEYEQRMEEADEERDEMLRADAPRGRSREAQALEQVSDEVTRSGAIGSRRSSPTSSASCSRCVRKWDGRPWRALGQRSLPLPGPRSSARWSNGCSNRSGSRAGMSSATRSRVPRSRSRPRASYPTRNASVSARASASSPSRLPRFPRLGRSRVRSAHANRRPGDRLVDRRSHGRARNRRGAARRIEVAMNERSQVDIDRLLDASRDVARAVADRAAEQAGTIRVSEVGRVTYVGEGVARVAGLPGVASQELVEFDSGARGTAFSLEENEVAVMLIDRPELVAAGDRVRRTGRVVSVPVGDQLLGRVSTRSAARSTVAARSRRTSGGASSSRVPASWTAIRSTARCRRVCRSSTRSSRSAGASASSSSATARPARPRSRSTRSSTSATPTSSASTARWASGHRRSRASSTTCAPTRCSTPRSWSSRPKTTLPARTSSVPTPPPASPSTSSTRAATCSSSTTT